MMDPSKDPKREIFSNVLDILRLEAKKFQTLIELVEALAWQDVEEKTLYNRENIADWIPWDFIPNTADYKRSLVTHANQAKFHQLKYHVDAVRKILEDVVCR
jgi:hypothetical protein